MLNRTIGKVVDLCTRFMWVTILAAAVLTGLSIDYAMKHFAINTDIAKLISPDLPWRKRELTFQKAFPQTFERILVVVDAPTPESAQQAAGVLSERLSKDTALFHYAQPLGAGEFFQRSAFLFLSPEELGGAARKLVQATPIVSILAGDPSLRGLGQALSTSFIGITRKQLTLDDMSRTLNAASDTFDAVLAGKPTNFSWQELMRGKPSEAGDLRRFIDVWPVLDFTALEPGAKPIAAIRQAAKDLNLEKDYGARVRLTGPVPISDEEFGTLKENATLNAVITVAIVLLILWLALKSARIIVAVALTLVAGLAMTAALGFMLVPALNPISIAFAVLFVGLGVDFGIQYSVRYRAERHAEPNLRKALINAGRRAGAPLTLAAVATAAGFWSFLPTNYKGLSELGLIAGSGMLIAYATSITILPALLKLLNPRGEEEPLGYAAMAPVDRFLERNRMPVIILTGLIVLGGLPLLLKLQFDFNPQNLRSPKVESIATYMELRKDPATAAHTVQVLAPSVAQAKETATKLSTLPEVARTETVESFIPADQTDKLKIIADMARPLTPALNPANPKPMPTDAERVTAINTAIANLNRVAGQDPNQGIGVQAAKRLADTLTKLAAADANTRIAAEDAMVRPLRIALAQLNDALQAKPVSLDTLPRPIAESWVTPNGGARVDVFAKGDPDDTDTLRRFVTAIRAVQPDATGEAVGIMESGDTVVRSFIEAGFWALCSIAILLWIVLRRFGDVLLTLIPLLLAGALTLEICVLIGLKLNFANIIALPLLLGVGVAFKIYYVMAWRAGQTNLLQSSLTRAVFFSSLTTATAFGSLWFSSHPGTSSMGQLLVLSLLCTMSAAVLFQPVLMGRPRVLKEPDIVPPDERLAMAAPVAVKPNGTKPSGGKHKANGSKPASPKSERRVPETERRRETRVRAGNK